MRQLYFWALIFFFLSACKATANSTLNANTSPRIILFKISQDSFLIKECANNLKDTLTLENCDIKHGTVEVRTSRAEFVSHLIDAIYIWDYSFTSEIKRELESLNSFLDSLITNNDKQNNAAKYYKNEIAQLMKKKDRIDDDLYNRAAYGTDNILGNLIKSIFNSTSFEDATFILQNIGYNSAFVFDVLSAYIIPKKLNWKFVNLSKVNDTGFPTEFIWGSQSGWGRPAHPVRLTQPFAVQTTEVTQSQWVEIMGYNPSHFNEQRFCAGDFDHVKRLCPSLPVERISWNIAQKFISKLNSTLGLDCGDTATMSGFVKATKTPGCYRLPTEAEWEYFARAGTQTSFNLGEKIHTNNINYKYNYRDAGADSFSLNFEQNPRGKYARWQTVPVASLKNSNRWGISDVHGNVHEWVQDKWQNGYGDSKSLKVDPLETKTKSTRLRVHRGGGYNDLAVNCTSFMRKFWYRDFRGSTSSSGFRLVRSGSE